MVRTRTKISVTQCWANRNPTGSKHNEHMYIQIVLFSGVFSDNEKLPPIQLAKTIQDQVYEIMPTKYNHVNAKAFMERSLDKPGELILFPSSLKHCVEPINQRYKIE